MSAEAARNEFATALRRAIAEHEGGTFTSRAISIRTEVPAPTLREILTGRIFPQQSMLQQIIDNLALDPRTKQEILDLWKAAAAGFASRWNDQDSLFPPRPDLGTDGRRRPPRQNSGGPTNLRGRRRSPQPVPQFGQPDPIRVSTPAELVQALRAVHVWGGSPSLRELESRSTGRLRRSSISDMLRSSTLPDYDRFIAFLRVCGIEGASLDVWVFTWRRLKAMETPEIASWMPGMWGAAS
ncbi:hypothetical protein ABZZ74_47765 [Streptomyces sp. NPDC006476]|uniref:hypothetical protein n=1 Tax=Streptomyces sp. NPDC006476 TaxID=3157175 RepID=UPI0033A3071B